jgi:hypothetical protein
MPVTGRSFMIFADLDDRPKHMFELEVFFPIKTRSFFDPVLPSLKL